MPTPSNLINDAERVAAKIDAVKIDAVKIDAAKSDAAKSDQRRRSRLGRVCRFALLVTTVASLPCQVHAIEPSEPASSLTASVSGERTEQRLWEGAAPGATGERPEDIPRLLIELPAAELRTGVAIVVLPGGGYGGLAMGHEGDEIAAWLTQNGIAAFICDYRHRGKGYGHPAPLLDAQRAIRTVRARAAEWGVDPAKIGIIGFSAGGHLASTAATHFDAGNAEAEDPIDRVSCRPDFAVLCYPVISLGEAWTHKGSQNNLLGENPDPELVRKLSNEKSVTAENPPTFLWHTTEDSVVPVENAIEFYLALKRNAVPCELMIFERGRHGLGLAKGIPSVSSWPDRWLDWMRIHGWLPAVE